MSEKNYLSGWGYRTVIITALTAAVGYLCFYIWGGRQGVSEAIAKVGVAGLAAAMALAFANYSIRFLRWQMYFSALDQNLPSWPSFKIYLAGFALTTTPGRAGEGLRAVLFKRLAVPYPKSFAAYFSERLSDLFAITLLTLSGLTLYSHANGFILFGVGLTLAGAALLLQRELILRAVKFVPKNFRRTIQLAGHLGDMLLEAQRCNTPKIFIVAALLGIFACTLEAAAFYYILGWIGADLPISFAIFVYSVSILAGALSFIPGGLGGVEAVMVAMLMWKGVSNADAIAATVLIRLCTLWFSVAVGVIALMNVDKPSRPA